MIPSSACLSWPPDQSGLAGDRGDHPAAATPRDGTRSGRMGLAADRRVEPMRTNILLRTLVPCSIASLVLVAGFAVANAAHAAGPVGPSFRCPQTSEIEAAICGDPELAADDLRMRTLYEAAKSGALGRGSNQLAAQREWLTERADCGRGGWKKYAIIGQKNLRDCLAGKYQERLEALAIADLFTAHDAAIAEIRRDDSKAAQLYEAMYRYGVIDNSGERKNVVGTLIGPVFETLRIHPAQVGPDGSRIAASADTELEPFKTADAVASSDEGFSTFLRVASGWIMDERMVAPCGLLARRPGLLSGFDERWSPLLDCGDTLPATPRLDHLIQAAREATPPITGTIRIDMGASYEVLVTAVRLNLPTHWRGPKKSWILDGSPPVAERRFRARHGADIAAATVEMTGLLRAHLRPRRTPRPGPSAGGGERPHQRSLLRRGLKGSRRTKSRHPPSDLSVEST